MSGFSVFGLRLPFSEPRAVLSPILLIIILFGAAFLRFYRLDSIPPGLTHDEADTGYFVSSVYRGEPAEVQVPYGYAYKPFTKYSGALFMALFGATDLALRIHSAFFGLLLVLFTYLWGREAFGTTVGLGSAALVAVSFWTVSDSRFALNSGPAPALFTGAAYFLWRALDNGREAVSRWAWGMFALLLAGSLYVYEAALAAAVSLILHFFYLAVVHPSRFRRHGVWFAGALVAAGALAAPHLLNPVAWGRTNTLSEPLRAASRGDLAPLLNNVISALGTFSFSGDSLVTYNLPNRPIFDPLTSLFFYGGVALCLRRWRKPAYAFVMMWVVMGIVPSLVVGEWTSTLHSKAAEAPIMALPALGAVEVGRFLTSRFGRRWGHVFAVVCAIWVLVIAGTTGYDYFFRWGQAPETRAAYMHNLSAVTDYLNEVPYSGVVTLSSPFPNLPLDPFVADLTLHRDDLSVRWVDARRALVFPDASRSMLVLPPNTPLAPYFGERLELQLLERVNLRPSDVDPYFDVFTWNSTDALAQLLQPTSGEIAAGGERVSLPVNLGGAVELVAYQLLDAEVSSGETVRLVTFWRVLDPSALGPVPSSAYGYDAKIFVHVLDGAGVVVGQEDRLDAPAWNWHSGEGFVQVHRLQIDADTTPGDYPLQVGMYTNYADEDLARLPIRIDGQELDDRVLLQPLRVRGQ
jgi:4-amino-4-deoxy-L-arabinose transferase-like glycosyltransferase